ncbi:hypothetical protein ACROYT_G019208 [Oculina patagonica]
MNNSLYLFTEVLLREWSPAYREATRTALVAKEMAEYGIDIQGISQTRWKWMGSATLQSGKTVVYVGDDEMQQGG